MTHSDRVQTAEVLSNAYFGVLITFWDESDELISGLEQKNIEGVRLACTYSRLSTHCKYSFQNAEKCLLTNMDSLTNAFRREYLNPLFFEAVQTFNLRVEKRHVNT